MNKITLLLILLLAGRLHAQTGLFFPKKINRVVIGYDFDTVRNQRVIIEAVYYKRVGYKALFSETYRVTTDKNGMAAIVRGTGYKRTGNYKDVEKLLLEDDNAAIQLIHMRDDDHEIADLGKIYPSGKLKQKPARSKPALKEPEEVINVWEVTPAQTQPATRNVTAVTAREDRPIPDTANDILSFRNWYFIRYDAKDPEKPITDTAPRTGYFERAASGLKLYANAVQDNWIKAREPMDFTGRTVYMKWKTETNGRMCDMRWN